MEATARLEQARFVKRDRCVGCESSHLARVAGGRFTDEPLRSFIAGDPWGECPLPHLGGSEWELVACRDCGQVFHRHVLDPEWQGVRFSKWMGGDAMREFERRNATGATFPRRLEDGRRWVAHALRIEKLTRAIRSDGCRVLDFGCGWGAFIEIAGSLGFDAYGVDCDAHRVATMRGLRVFPDLEVLDMAAREPFHAVTLFEVLEHVEEPLPLLRALRARLVPGGILVLETPDCAGVRGIASMADYRAVHPLDHINGFTAATLASVARRAGFEVVAPPIAYVTTEAGRVARAVARSVKRRLRPTTQLYARAVETDPSHASRTLVRPRGDGRSKKSRTARLSSLCWWSRPGSKR